MSGRVGTKKRRVLVDALLERDGDRCVWCCRPMLDLPIDHRADCSLHMTLEHLTPLAVGGTNETWNLALACYACNNLRGAYLGDFQPPWSDVDFAHGSETDPGTARGGGSQWPAGTPSGGGGLGGCAGIGN